MSEPPDSMSTMQHFPIVRSLVRVALAHDTGPLSHQVERLIEALRADGDTTEAAALKRLLNQRSRAHELAPSRIKPSGSALVRKGERLTASTAVPVDKETSAPLATILFPEDIQSDLPLFPSSLQDNIESLLLEWEHSDRIAQAGMHPSLTCLIYGAPGTGKTTLALWLARRLGLPVVLARLDGLISSFLGTTARNVGALFAFANRYQCVLVLDEFDAIAKVRDDPNEVGEIKRVVNALLQNIDAREGRGITIALTNHESLLDPAIWRRFEVQLAVPLPRADQRVKIAQRYLDQDEEVPGADARLLAWACEGLSGAEVRTMATKFRKRRLIQPEIAPMALVSQLARSTSVKMAADRSELLSSDETLLTRVLAASEVRFTHAELAAVFQCSTKTIGRRISESSESGE